MPSAGLTTDKTILCVDDNENGLQIRKAMLEAFGFNVEIVTSGRAALDLLQHRTFDVVVLDYQMPHMNGAELTDAIRAKWPDLPLVMLTGYPHEIPPRTLQQLDVMLVKGSRPEKLLETLLQLTHSSFKRASGSVHQMVNRNSRQVADVKNYLKDLPHRR